MDRLVLLGDTLELRDGPQRDASALAAPFFSAVGRALGPRGEILLLSGNHDHGLVAGWIDGRLQTEPAGFLGLEQRIAPVEAGRLAAALAKDALPARVTVAYPGVWLRDDVYAMHGHYSDVHTTVPTFERLAAGAMARFVTSLPEHGATPDDYEGVLSPLYAWMHVLAQRSDRTLVARGSGASARAWVALSGGGDDRRPDPVRSAALAVGFVVAVAALNRIGLGPIRRELTGTALRQGGLDGIREVLRRLGVDAPRVIWGHSHRSGPWPRDRTEEWVTPGGTRLHNTGSWVYQRHFLTSSPEASPYWPGTAIELRDGEPPRLRRLLSGLGHEELRAPLPA